MRRLIKMSGQDDKMEITYIAGKKYSALIKLLRKAGNPLLPPDLEYAMSEYEKIPRLQRNPKWRVSLDFDYALQENWRQIDVPLELRSKLERIATERGPGFVQDERQYWEEWKRLVE